MTQREGLAGVEIEYTDQVIALLMREGYDQRFGARPLQRAIERLVVTPLARWKIANLHSPSARLQVDLNEKGEVNVAAVCAQRIASYTLSP